MRYIGKFQDGGAPMAPEQEAAPMGPEQGGGDPMAQIQQMAQQIIEQLGPDAAAALAQTIMEMLQGGQAPQGQAPAMRYGGRFARKAGTLSNGSAYFKSY